MSEHEQGEEIIHVNCVSELCKQTFIEKDTATRIIWTFVIVLLTLGGSSIAWALTMSSAVSALETRAVYQEQRIHQLDELINKKLDILIQKYDDAEKARKLHK